jgi:L-ribulose-5-phosphate 3-epimerase
MNRREFLATAGTAASVSVAAAPLQDASGGRLPIRKGILLGMLPKELSVTEKFQMARDCGFEQMECPTTPEGAQAEEIKAAAEKTGVPIHSVMNMAHWQYPLSSPDPEVVKKSVAGMETSLRNAHLWGADTVLLVPAVVNPQISYADAWKRSQEQIRKMIPLAKELKVVIAVENVWNKFLLSPLEFARYVDDFKSPWVKAYFDVGNVVLFGYPQDWIRTLGPRIAKLHLKDFAFRNDPTVKKRVADWVNLREGEIDWKAIYDALKDIGYKGSATVELSGGDANYLKDLSHRVDMIFSRA